MLEAEGTAQVKGQSMAHQGYSDNKKDRLKRMEEKQLLQVWVNSC